MEPKGNDMAGDDAERQREYDYEIEALLERIDGTAFNEQERWRAVLLSQSADCIRALRARLSRSTSTDAVAWADEKNLVALKSGEEFYCSVSGTKTLKRDVPLYTHPSLQGGAEPDGRYRLVPIAALEWLNGEAPDPAGLWFGDFPDDHPKPAGAFWWRKQFADIISYYERTHPIGETGGADQLVAKLIDEFEEAAKSWGWYEDSGASEESSEAHTACFEARAKLVGALTSLRAERDAAVQNADKVCDSYAAENQRLFDKAEAAEQRVAALVGALKATEQPLEHASQCLDGIVTHDDEDMTKDGGSATCQSVKKTVDRALKNVRAALATEA